MEYEKFEDILDYVLRLKFNGIEAKYYARFEKIKARQGKFLEVIENKSSDGMIVKKEYVTRDNVNNKLDWIITLDSGRQVLMRDSLFTKKYKVFDEKQGLYISKDVEKFVQIDDNIEFSAPWGEVLRFEKGDYLNITNTSKVYGIKKPQFKKYYAECDEKGKFVDVALNNTTEQELTI